MFSEERSNYAFIDSQNLNLGIQELGWKLDFKRFRIYLAEKFKVTKAFVFIGYIKGNNDLYIALQDAGFICIFKPTLEYKNRTTKGNCDAELVLHTMIEYPHYQKAVVATGDGDFYCLVEHLVNKNKFEALLIPNKHKFSALLKFRICRPYLRYMNDLEKKVGFDKKRPHKDKTL